MITEDYCSFEISKLLKEKGFDEKCVAYYPQCITPIKLTFGGRVNYNSSNKFKMLPPISAPTQQMAMAWLRKNDIFIEIDTIITTDKKVYFSASVGTIEDGWKTIAEWVETYEAAVEMALKYSLENLI